jgi:predicted nucleic acid-binding protein
MAGEADPTRVVADADVLAADLLVGGGAREAVDHARRHSWVELVASDPLLDDAEAVVAALSDPTLAADWRERVEDERVPVDHPPGDHPGLASAVRGGAAHLLSFDEDLSSARTGLSLQPHVGLSVRQPEAFARVFAPEPLYESVVGGDYPGPDRDPRG